MDAAIDFTLGPLFRISLAILVLGLAYRVVVALVQIVRAWSQAADRTLPLAQIATNTLRWAFPVRLFTSRPLFSAISVIFHVGIILLPLFLLGHVALLGAWLPAAWPTLPANVADALTIITAIALIGLLVGRLAVKRARELSRPWDSILIVLLFALVASGYLASHPTQSPFDARAMLLVHGLIGNAALIITPMTKIAHCVLFPFSQLVFDLGWHYPPHTGRRVAIALGKENEPV